MTALRVAHDSLLTPTDANNLWNKSNILDFPLVAPINTAKNLNSLGKGKNIYFGTGVVTSKAISQGLPFDFLGMLLTAEWVRRQTEAQGIIHEISDSHALITSDHNAEDITKVAYDQKKQITQLVMALGMDDYYRCVLASEYRNKKIFAEIQSEVDRLSPPETSPYFRYQSAGNLYFARHEDVACKIGWVLEDNEKPPGFDERRFNDSYDKLGLEPLCFMYTWAGRNFDEKRTRVAPYTTTHGEKRLMLSSEQDAYEELNNLIAECQNKKVCQSAIAHLARIVMAYDDVLGLKNVSFWTQNPIDSNRSIKIQKQAPWVLAEYVDLTALANSIDEIRTLGNRSYDSDLRDAIHVFMSVKK